MIYTQQLNQRLRLRLCAPAVMLTLIARSFDAVITAQIPAMTAAAVAPLLQHIAAGTAGAAAQRQAPAAAELLYMATGSCFSHSLSMFVCR